MVIREYEPLKVILSHYVMLFKIMLDTWRRKTLKLLSAHQDKFWIILTHCDVRHAWEGKKCPRVIAAHAGLMEIHGMKHKTAVEKRSCLSLTRDFVIFQSWRNRKLFLSGLNQKLFLQRRTLTYNSRFIKYQFMFGYAKKKLPIKLKKLFLRLKALLNRLKDDFKDFMSEKAQKGVFISCRNKKIIIFQHFS